jgi:sulfotransferase 6B1
MVDRMLPAPPGPRAVANSMPKSGTHLLATLYDQLEGMRLSGRLVAFDCGDRFDPAPRLKEIDKVLRRLRDSRYVGGHLICEPEIEAMVRERNIKLVTILRDPRAVIVSGAHYVMDAKQLKGRDEALELFPDRDSMLRALVFGYAEPGEKFYFPEIGERFRAYASWVDSSVGLTVRFEDLIGGRGGGSDDEQVEKVAQIVQFLGYGDGAESATAIAERLFSEKVITFRAGTIDSWREDLPADLAREIEERCADSMARLGYER